MVGLVHAMERLPRRILSFEFDLDKAINDSTASLRVLAAKAGIDEHDHAYYRVSQAADAIVPGFRAVYVAFNIFLSKLVHPTALSVKVSLPEALTESFTAEFLKAGAEIMEQVIVSMSRFVEGLESRQM